MATTTKRKRDEDDNDGPLNKKIKSSDTGELPSQLIPELWLHILVFIPSSEIGPIRLVSRQWNKMTHSKDYGKALCVRKFGHNIGPLKITNLASLAKVADSDLVLIPTIQEGSKMSVDWFAYYDARLLLRTSMHDLSYYMEHSKQELLNSDLTYTIIKLLIDTSESEGIEFIFPINLLLTVIPLLVQYERIELASRALKLVLMPDMEDFSNPRNIDQLIDLNELVSSHFPDHNYRVFEMTCKATILLIFYVSRRCSFKLEGRSKIFCERVFPRLLRTIIQRGSKQSEGHGEDIESIIRANHSQRRNFPIILNGFSEDPFLLNALHSAIVPICQMEFELTDEWQVKESALLTTCISNCTHAGYSQDCVKFATKVLSDKLSHQQVLQAAVIVMCSKLIHSIVKMSQEEFDLAFECLIWASDRVKPKNILLNIINGLISLLRMPGCTLSEEKLDLFHTTLFKILLIPGVFRESINTSEHTNVIKGSINKVVKYFGHRLIKYLPQYRETYFKLASISLNNRDITPAQIVSYYVEIGPLIDPKNFFQEAIEIVKKVQDGTIGFTVNVAEFHACCTTESLSAPGADPRTLIESILTLYPNEVIKPIHKVKENETEPENSHAEFFPDYIPHFKDQYHQAIKQMHHIDPKDHLNLFNFSLKPQSSTRMTLYQPELVPLANFQMGLVNKFAMAGLDSLIEVCQVNNYIWQERTVERVYPIILSLFINYLRMDMAMKQSLLHGTKILLQEISEKFPSPIVECYVTATLDALNHNYAISFAQHGENRKYLHDSIHDIILSKFTDPSVDLLSKYFDMLFCFGSRAFNTSWQEKIQAFEEIILQWPRTAWTALCRATIARDLLLDEYCPHRTQADGVGRKLVWRLLMKYYGYSRVAALISRFKQFNVPLGYFYEHVSSCLQRLNSSSNEEHLKETLTKFATFCRVYQIDKNAGDVCLYNQYIIDQSTIGQILHIINPEIVIKEFKGNYFSWFFYS